MSKSPIQHPPCISEQMIRDFLQQNIANTRVINLESSEGDEAYAQFYKDVAFAYQQLSPDWLQYDLEYASLLAQHQVRYAIIFETNNEMEAIWVLTLSIYDERIFLGTLSLPIYPPLIRRGTSIKRIKSIAKSCIQLGDFVANYHNLEFWNSTEYGPISHGLSNWYSVSRFHGASCQLETHLFVDLSLTDDEYRTRIRSSNKSTISAGLKRWNPEIYTGSNPTEWEEFRELHRKVSGRITRSKKTWDIQLQMIHSGSAFAVFIRDANKSLIGGALLAHTRDEGIYVTGVFDRDFNEPSLGHISQWNGIQELKRRGVQWYKLGDRTFPSSETHVEEKEIAIAHFKEGYATHMFPIIHFRHTPKTK